MDIHDNATGRVFAIFPFQSRKKESPYVTCLERKSGLPSSRCFHLLLLMLVIAQTECTLVQGEDKLHQNHLWLGQEVTLKKFQTRHVPDITAANLGHLLSQWRHRLPHWTLRRWPPGLAKCSSPTRDPGDRDARVQNCVNLKRYTGDWETKVQNCLNSKRDTGDRDARVQNCVNLKRYTGDWETKVRNCLKLKEKLPSLS
jgi:hypothetical protein